MRSRPLEEEPPAARRSASSWAWKLAWVAVPLIVLGEAGHHLLERLGQTLAHHFFHVVFGGGAVAVFVSYVVIDIRRHGWPTFSWRIREDVRPPEPTP